MAVNDEGGVWSGAVGPGIYIDEVMKYDKDKVGGLLYIKKGTTKLMHMINKRFGKRNVTSFTPKWFDIDEMDNIFLSKTNMTTGTWNTITMTNAQALQLQPGDLLSVDGLFHSNGDAGGSAGTYSRVWSSQYNMEEVVMVTLEPKPDSGGTGLANVTVRRGYSGAFDTGRIMAPPTASNSGCLTDADRLMHIGNAQFTGSDAPRGKGKNIEVDSNYLQIQRYAFEEQTETNMESTFMPEKPLSISQKLAMNQMAYNLEWAALYGRRSKEQEGTSWRYTTGGVFEYVNNYIDYSNGGTITNLTWFDFQRTAMAPIFDAGGTSEKVAFMSINQYSAFAQMLWDKVQISINEQWTKEFGFEVTKIHGGGGSLNLVPSWVYGQNRFRSNQILVLDFGGPHFKIDVMEDLHIEKDLQLPGQRIKKHGYITIAGMQRRARQYHCILTGMPPLA
jgi:hypothetical protein